MIKKLKQINPIFFLLLLLPIMGFIALNMNLPGAQIYTLMDFTVELISPEFPELEIESIEITLNLTRTRAAAIRFVPAIKIGEDVLTGIILTPTKIRQFIKKHISSKQK